MGMQTPRGGFKILISTISSETSPTAGIHTVVTSFPTKGEADFAADAINDRNRRSTPIGPRQNALRLYPA
ncbi:hypothetical protein [Burkholderia phage vB_BglM_WTB]